MSTALCPEPGRPSREERQPTKQSLSPAQRRLVERFQSLNFGCIRGLHVRDGEPVFDPPFEAVRTLQLRGSNIPRPEHDLSDFVLKREVVEFLRLLAEIDTGVIETVKIQNGLPVQAEVVETVTA